MLFIATFSLGRHLSRQTKRPSRPPAPHPLRQVCHNSSVGKRAHQTACPLGLAYHRAAQRRGILKSSWVDALDRLEQEVSPIPGQQGRRPPPRVRRPRSSSAPDPGQLEYDLKPAITSSFSLRSSRYSDCVTFKTSHMSIPLLLRVQKDQLYILRSKRRLSKSGINWKSTFSQHHRSSRNKSFTSSTFLKAFPRQRLGVALGDKEIAS